MGLFLFHIPRYLMSESAIRVQSDFVLPPCILAGRKGLESQRKIALYPSGGLMSDLGYIYCFSLRQFTPNSLSTSLLDKKRGRPVRPQEASCARREARVCPMAGTGLPVSGDARG